jgi:hypothetical protein
MFSYKYPILMKSINEIEDKSKFLKNIDSIKLNDCNVIYVTDYEITCKISQFYLNDEIPISRNSNTACIRIFYASYVYYLTVYILTGLNNVECFSHGEFMIPVDKLINLINEIIFLIEDICEKIKNDNPLEELKIIMKLIANNMPIEFNVKNDNITNTFREEPKHEFRDSDNNRRLETINDIYNEQELFKDSDSNTNVGRKNSDTLSDISDEYIEDIKKNVVNILTST